VFDSRHRVCSPARGSSRGLVQPPPPALDARLPVPDRVRASARRGRPTGARGPDFGPPIGLVDLAERLRSAYNAPHLDGRRRSRRRRLDRSRERLRDSNRSRSGRDERRSRDERPPLASPTGSQGTSSLIQTSTTTAKTCRPNRGRPDADDRFPISELATAPRITAMMVRTIRIGVVISRRCPRRLATSGRCLAPDTVLTLAVVRQRSWRRCSESPSRPRVGGERPLPWRRVSRYSASAVS
jgi:hypothetical protein